MSAKELACVSIATGAFDCGKTTTLEWLRAHHGLRIHAEAHLQALAALGPRCEGHPPNASFTRIEDPAHLCPMCRPWAFAELVLDEQRSIERAAEPGDLLERGYLDPIEMLLRNTDAADDAPRPDCFHARGNRPYSAFGLRAGSLRVPQADCFHARGNRPYSAFGLRAGSLCVPRPDWTPITRYARVFLFEVMPQLQRPRWGKGIAQRTHEAVAINRRLERLYRNAGYEVIHVAPASVEARADLLLFEIERQ
jgi:hypothetical protein